MVASTVRSTNGGRDEGDDLTRHALVIARTPIRTSSPATRSPVRRGLTMIELLIVVAIVGILATISIPRINALRAGMMVDAAANQVLGDLRRARSEALKRNKSILMQKTGSATYSVDSIGLRMLPNSAEFSAGSDSVRFSSFGPPISGGASFTISLDGRTKRVVLTAAGLMTVE